MASNLSTLKYLDYSGLTYLVQNHIIDKKIGTTVGDILYVSAVNNNIPTYSRLGVPTYSSAVDEGHYVLHYSIGSGGVGNVGPNWVDADDLIEAAGFMNNPMTSEGDIVYAKNDTDQGGHKLAKRLALGSTGQVLIARNDATVKQPDWTNIKWVVGTYDASANPYTTVQYVSAQGLCIDLPDIQSIPNTGTNSIESLFS